MSVKVVLRYDREGRLSSVEVSGDPAAVHQVLSQILTRAPAPEPEPERPAPEPAPKQANGRRARRAQQAAQQPQQAEPARQEGLPEFARDNPWLPILARAKQS
jgi:hypothetical protein